MILELGGSVGADLQLGAVLVQDLRGWMRGRMDGGVDARIVVLVVSEAVQEEGGGD